MQILIIGQCTLHWGRMEFGNIGNYYIIEPLVRELYSVFPNAKIKTTMQMSARFQEDECVEVVPMGLFYGWLESDLETALVELGIAEVFSKTGKLPSTTPFIDEVMQTDLVIDFSGDIWGDNSNFLGKNRFLVGLIKDRVSQLLGKKTAMIAGSPGPFDDQEVVEFAKEVYRNFDIVTNRESISLELLKNYGFDVSRTVSLACPAFLFEPRNTAKAEEVAEKIGLNSVSGLKVGFILCGWNFLEGPFDKWPRRDEEYIVFAEAVEMLDKLGCIVYLMSHSNGFPIPPAKFELQHGRDYVVAKQLEDVLKKRGIAKNVQVIEDVLDTWETKQIISNFDMLISGRIHGAVAGLSQLVPTVIIDYGHEPKAHKLQGFAIEAGAESYVSDPAVPGDIQQKVKIALNALTEYKAKLAQSIPVTKQKAKQNFVELKRII
jgi:colanic acid/amylovoran biosynthesis protein